MNRTSRSQKFAPRVLILGLAASAWLRLGLVPANAQQIQTRLPSFQAPASDSLESQILARLSITGEYQPEDLPRLARLAVLRSIATVVNIRVDLQGSPLGLRLDGEATSLWDAAQAFSDTVSAAPLDLTTMPFAQYDFAEMETAARQLDATLGEFPGLSNGAATNLQAVATLFDASNDAMGTIESNLVSGVPAPVDRAIDFDVMRTQAQLLANDLVVLIGKVSESKERQAGRNGVLDDLNAMLVLVRDFGRSLAIQPSFEVLNESYRVARRRMWHVEAKINQLEWPADLRRQWRGVRERANAISDQFGLPRVMVSAPGVPRAAGANHKLVDQVDRSIAWVDEYLAVPGPELRQKPARPQLERGVVKMRRQLLEFRRRAIVDESTERLSLKLRANEVTNQDLAARARDVERGHRDGKVTRFRNPEQAVKSLRGIIAPQ